MTKITGGDMPLPAAVKTDFPLPLAMLLTATALALGGCAASRGLSVGSENKAHKTLTVGERALWPCSLRLDPTLSDPLDCHPLLVTLRPSNQRDWVPEQAVLPSAEFLGDEVLVHNIRCCEYRSAEDFTVKHYDKTFDLQRIRSVDFLVCPFASSPGMAHTMISFGFEDEEYLAVSVEVRRERGESYDPLKGLLHQYEIMYVVADERDLIQLRTNHWQNEVFLYHTLATPEAARGLFVDVMRRVNKLRASPEFYNTLTNNCTTNIAQHVNRLLPEQLPLDYRLLLAGRSDRMAYELGLLDTQASFAETRARARVNYLAYLHRDDGDFSAKIRQR